MGLKTFTRAWKKDKIIFPSVYGVKDMYAFDLLANEEIKMSASDYKKFSIKTTDKEASRYLESHGWEWVKIAPIEM